MQQLVTLIQSYGLPFVFLHVLALQSGVPVPAYPTLIVAAALSAGAGYSAPQILLVAVCASLMADLGWYIAGAKFGRRVLRTLCRISLSPDSCVRLTDSIYRRWGAPSLVVAKFIPGFAAVATALAGVFRTRLWAFILFDALGAALWAGLAVGLGVLFRDAVNDVLNVLEQLGKWGMLAVITAFALVIAVKWWQRHRFYRQLRMARVSVEELRDMLVRGDSPAILDVRLKISQGEDDRIPGARMANDATLEADFAEFPPDGEVIVYCQCPNEASAAVIAKRLMKLGFTRVRPLKGGIDAWVAAGYAIERN